MFIIISIFSLISLLFLYIKQRLSSEIYRVPTLPHGHWLKGNLPSLGYRNGELNKDVTGNLHVYYEQYLHHGALRVSCGILLPPTIWLLTPKNVQLLLSNEKHTNRAFHYRLGAANLGSNNIVLSNGDDWHRRRRLLVPAFRMKTMTNFVAIMNEKLVKMNALIVRHIDECEGLFDNIENMITYYSMSVLLEATMGYSNELSSSFQEQFTSATKKILSLGQKRLMKPWLFFDFFLNRSKVGAELQTYVKLQKDYVNEVIKIRKDYIMKKREKKCVKFDDIDVDIDKKKRLAFLDLLLESHIECPNTVTEDDIRSEMTFIMLGGHESTAAAIMFALFRIGHDDNVQATIIKEMDDVFGYDCDSDITMKDIKKLRYTEYCVMEALRIYPPVNLIGRQISEPLVLDNGIKLPKGTDCFVPIFLIHMNRDLYPDPNGFIPDRFDPDAYIKVNQYSKLPFSVGPRDCIGQKYAMTQAKLVLAYIFRKYRIKSLTPINDVKFKFNLAPKLQTELKIKFEFR